MGLQPGLGAGGTRGAGALPSPGLHEACTPPLTLPPLSPILLRTLSLNLRRSLGVHASQENARLYGKLAALHDRDSSTVVKHSTGRLTAMTRT